MSKFNLAVLTTFVLLLNACTTAPIKKWDDASYGADRTGDSVVVAAPAITAAVISTCDMGTSANGSQANWEALNSPTSPAPTEEIYQKLVTANHGDAALSVEARNLTNTALEIHRKTGVSVIGLDTCDALREESLANYSREVQESNKHLDETGEFCPTSFAGIAINDQVTHLGKTPEGALFNVAQYEECGLGPRGIGAAAEGLSPKVDGLRDSGRDQLNPDEFRCAR